MSTDLLNVAFLYIYTLNMYSESDVHYIFRDAETWILRSRSKDHWLQFPLHNV